MISKGKGESSRKPGCWSLVAGETGDSGFNYLDTEWIIQGLSEWREMEAGGGIVSQLGYRLVVPYAGVKSLLAWAEVGHSLCCCFQEPSLASVFTLECVHCYMCWGKNRLSRRLLKRPLHCPRWKMVETWMRMIETWMEFGSSGDIWKKSRW